MGKNSNRTSSQMNILTIKCDPSELDKIRYFSIKCLAGLNISEKVHYMIKLSLMEICTNVIRYTYPKDKGDVFLKSWKDEGKIFFEIKDSGIPFDPNKIKTPEIKEIIKSEKKRWALNISHPQAYGWVRLQAGKRSEHSDHVQENQILTFPPQHFII